MKRAHAFLALLAAALGLVLVGCGGGAGNVPSGAIAVVDGTEIPRSDLDALVEQAKNYYEATKQDFPKVGTPEHQSIQQQYVAFLVQKTEFEQAAEDLGLQITDADVDKAYTDYVKTRFDGDEKKLEKALQAQGLSEEAFRDTLRVSVLSKKLFDEVTKAVKVTDDEALASYTQNQDQYRVPASRDVRHILFAKKRANDEVDFAKSKAEADRVYALAKGGTDFVSLVRQFSDDEGTKAVGGKYSAVRGASVPQFDRVAFQLETNEISRPVKTRYGYHIIQAIADTKPEKVTSFDQAKAGIKASLLQEKRNQQMTQWLQDLQKQYEDKVSYATGFAPPELPDPTETDTK